MLEKSTAINGDSQKTIDYTPSRITSVQMRWTRLKENTGITPHPKIVVWIGSEKVVLENRHPVMEYIIDKLHACDRYYVPMSIENKTPDVQAVIVALNSYNYLA